MADGALKPEERKNKKRTVMFPLSGDLTEGILSKIWIIDYIQSLKRDRKINLFKSRVLKAQCPRTQEMLWVL